MASRKQVLLQQLISAVLFVGVLAMLGWLSTRYKLEADWTAGNRNTLTEASRKLLDSLPDPIAFKVFLYPRSEMRQALEADIRQWIDTWNENPRPFTWTKTADEILNALAKYLARISGATH